VSPTSAHPVDLVVKRITCLNPWNTPVLVQHVILWISALSSPYVSVTDAGISEVSYFSLRTRDKRNYSILSKPWYTCRRPHTAAFQRIRVVLQPTRFSCTCSSVMKQVFLSQAHSFAACPCEVSKFSFGHALVQLNRKDRPLQDGLRQGGHGHQSKSNECICTHLVQVIAMWHFWTSVVAQSFSNWLLPTLPVVSRVHQKIRWRWFDAWHWEGICCQQHLQKQSGAHPAVVI
jgi:hypothetical protein